MATDNKDFFKQQTDSSRVKATIISEYFPSYCKIIGKRHVPKKFGYYDMFAGPGMYEDGGLSTPLLVADLRDKGFFGRLPNNLIAPQLAPIIGLVVGTATNYLSLKD